MTVGRESFHEESAVLIHFAILIVPPSISHDVQEETSDQTCVGNPFV